MFTGCHRVAVARIQQRQDVDVGYSLSFWPGWCYTPRVQALLTSHPVEQAEIAAQLGRSVCNFTLLLADLNHVLSFLSQFLAFTAFSCSRFASGSFS